MEFLINQGVNLNAKDKRGQTALDRAEREGHRGVVALLLAHGAKAGSQSGREGWPLYRDIAEPLLCGLALGKR